MDSLVTSNPLLAAAVILLLGFGVAALVTWLTERLLRWFERRLRDLAPGVQIIVPKTERLLKRTVYFVTVIVFAMVALRVIGLSELLDPALSALPGLVTGAVVILLGYLAGVFVYQLLMATPGASRAGPLIPRLAQIAVMTIAVLTGLSAMSVDVSLLGQSLLVLLIVTMGGMALAFALGSRGYVANLLARRIFSEFAVGDRIRVGDYEGVIIEFTNTSVLLRTDLGIAVVPASVLADSVVIRLTFDG